MKLSANLLIFAHFTINFRIDEKEEEVLSNYSQFKR